MASRGDANRGSPSPARRNSLDWKPRCRRRCQSASATTAASKRTHATARKRTSIWTPEVDVLQGYLREFWPRPLHQLAFATIGTVSMRVIGCAIRTIHSRLGLASREVRIDQKQQNKP